MMKTGTGMQSIARVGLFDDAKQGAADGLNAVTGNTQEMQEGRDIWHPASAEYTAYPSRSIAVIGPLLDTGVAYPAEKPWDETATTCRSIEDICGGDQCSIDVSGAGDLKDALYKCF